MVDTNPKEKHDEAQEPELNFRALIMKFIVGVVVMMGALGLLGLFFKDPLLELSAGFVDRLGGPGVALGFFVGDAFTLPVPHEAFNTFGLMGGLGFWTVVFWASAGSITGAQLGYLIGRKLSHTRLFARMIGKRGEQMRLLAIRYGVFFLVLGALTPLAFSVCVWTVAALGMRYRIFLAVTMLRIPRVMFYTWLIQLGLLNVLE